MYRPFQPTPSWTSPFGALQTVAASGRLWIVTGQTDSSLLAVLTLTQTPLEWVAGIHWKGQGGGGSWRGWRTNSQGQAQPFKARGSTLGLCPWLGVKHLVWLASLVFSFEKISQEPSLSPCSLWEGRLRPWLSTAAGQCDQEA